MEHAPEDHAGPEGIILAVQLAAKYEQACTDLHILSSQLDS